MKRKKKRDLSATFVYLKLEITISSRHNYINCISKRKRYMYIPKRVSSLFSYEKIPFSPTKRDFTATFINLKLEITIPFRRNYIIYTINKKRRKMSVLQIEGYKNQE